MRGSAGCFGKIRRFGRTGLIAAVLLAPLFAEAQFSGPDVVAPPSVLKTPKDVLERWLKVDCSYPGLADTYRECVQIVASRLPKLDESRRHHFGEQYSPKKYLECRLGTNHGETRCDVHALRRTVNPVYWPNPKVPMPSFPATPKEGVYRWWMNAKEYFEALCTAEAREVVHRAVPGVDGILLIRARSIETDLALQDRFVVEDPYGHDDWQARDPHAGFLGPGRFSFVEIPHFDALGKSDRQVRRYFRADDPREMKPRIENVSTLASRYGIVWRGVVREADRDHRIAGGELLVVDLVTGEKLAFKRGFALGGPARQSPTGTYWAASRLCAGEGKRLLRLPEFLHRVFPRESAKEWK